MNPLYNAGIRLLRFGIAVGSLRSPKLKQMREGWRDTAINLEVKRYAAAPQGYDLWIHVASLGEFEQGRPLIEKIKKENPDTKILLSFFSPSGYNVRHDYPLVDSVVYLSPDSPADVRAFLEAARPKMAIFVKYEFWGNYLSELRRRNIPTYIISAIFRPKQRFFRRGGGVFRKMLDCFSHIYVQDENSRRLLASIGLDNVTVAGDTRFDRVTDIMSKTVSIPLLEKFCDGVTTLIAGSSWEPDEDVYIPYLLDHPQLHAIIALHEFDDSRLQKLLARLGGDAALYSQIKDAGAVPDSCRYIIIDSFGLLSSLYRYGQIAYIGGGFGAGIHNINEAAVYGMPVVFGPRHAKFKEAADLIEAGGGFEVTGEEDFTGIADRLIQSPDALAKAGKAAGDYIAQNIGATNIIYNEIFKN